MASRRLLNRLYYFTVEDEGILAEAFPKFETEAFCITYKVVGHGRRLRHHGRDQGGDGPARRALQPARRGGVGRGSRCSTRAQSKEELGEYEDALKALVLAHRAIAVACVGVNGDPDLGCPLAAERAGLHLLHRAGRAHLHLAPVRPTASEAVAFLKKRTAGDKKALEWAESIPLSSARELKSYH